jgi:hypothetical protein
LKDAMEAGEKERKRVEALQVCLKEFNTFVEEL